MSNSIIDDTWMLHQHYILRDVLRVQVYKTNGAINQVLKVILTIPFNSIFAMCSLIHALDMKSYILRMKNETINSA